MNGIEVQRLKMQERMLEVLLTLQLYGDPDGDLFCAAMSGKSSGGGKGRKGGKGGKGGAKGGKKGAGKTKVDPRVQKKLLLKQAGMSLTKIGGRRLI